MTVVSAPFGLRCVFHPSGEPRIITLENGVASGYATGLYNGTPVKLGDDGTLIATDIGADTAIGIFVGCFFTLNGVTFGPQSYWAPGQLYDPDTPMWAQYEALDFDAIYEAQANGPVAQTQLGETINLADAPNGTTYIGQSYQSLNSTSTGATGGTFIVQNIAPYSNNLWGDPFTIIRVRLNPAAGTSEGLPPFPAPGAVVDLRHAAGEYYWGGSLRTLNEVWSVTSAGGTRWVPNGDGTWTPFAANTLRRTAEGLAIEGSAVPRLKNNSDLTNASWTATDLTPLNNLSGPDGTSGWSRLTATGANATIKQAVTLASSTLFLSGLLIPITVTGRIYVTLQTDEGTTKTDITAGLIPAQWTQLGLAESMTGTNPIAGIEIENSGDVIGAALVHLTTEEHASFPILNAAGTATRGTDNISPRLDISWLANENLCAIATFTPRDPTGGFAVLTMQSADGLNALNMNAAIKLDGSNQVGVTMKAPGPPAQNYGVDPLIEEWMAFISNRMAFTATQAVERFSVALFGDTSVSTARPAWVDQLTFNRLQPGAQIGGGQPLNGLLDALIIYSGIEKTEDFISNVTSPSQNPGSAIPKGWRWTKGSCAADVVFLDDIQGIPSTGAWVTGIRGGTGSSIHLFNLLNGAVSTVNGDTWVQSFYAANYSIVNDPDYDGDDTNIADIRCEANSRNDDGTAERSYSLVFTESVVTMTRIVNPYTVIPGAGGEPAASTQNMMRWNLDSNLVAVNKAMLLGGVQLERDDGTGLPTSVILTNNTGPVTRPVEVLTGPIPAGTYDITVTRLDGAQTYLSQVVGGSGWVVPTSVSPVQSASWTGSGTGSASFMSATMPSGWTLSRGDTTPYESAATRFDSTGTMVRVMGNVPRFTYNKDTLVLEGLLNERESINYIGNNTNVGAHVET